MKTLTIAAILCGFLALGASLFAQEPTNIYAAGISYNNGASPSIAGTALYARKLTDGTGTYAFTSVDALPIAVKPFTVQTNFSAGVAQKVLTIGKYNVFIPTGAGVSYTGVNTGWAWSTGAAVIVPLKGNLALMPNVRFLKSNVDNGAGVRPIAGILVSWGQ